MAIPTWNGFAQPEVGAVSGLVGATPGGLMLTLSPGGNNKLAVSKLTLCTNALDPVDAIMVSEVVDAATYTAQRFLFNTIDYSGYTAIGEPVSVLKGFKGLTMCSLAWKKTLGVTDVTLLAGGTGYTNGTAVLTAVGGTSTLAFAGTANVVGGIVVSITVTQPGEYTVAPTSFTAPLGVGLSAAAVLGGIAALSGAEAVIDPATSQLQVRLTGDVTSPTVAVLADPIAATATVTGLVHLV